MNTLLFLVGLFLVATAVLVAVALKRKTRQPAAKYQQTKPLTEPEQVLYWRLVEALPECVVLSQVSFSRFMRPEAGSDYRTHQNKIAQKSADFLVCLKDFSIVAAIELDDGSHNAKADAARDALLGAAGIAVLRVTVRDVPTVAKLREMLAGA